MEQRPRSAGDENLREGLLTGIVLALFLLPLAKGLLGQSTTSDGVIYASIARNLAEHQGAFWDLQFSATFLNPFHEHPPLAMWLESGLFRLFGDPYWVERVFSMLCFLALVTILGMLWRQAGSGRRFPAWPLLFLALMPHAYRTVYDHYLELPLAVFAAMAVLAQLKCLAASARGRSLAWCVLAAASLLGAFLVKGPVGLFPLVVMPLRALVGAGERRPWLGKFMLLTALCATAAGFLWLGGESREFLRAYFAKTVMSGLTGERAIYHARHALGLSGVQTVVQGRWFFLTPLAMNLAAGILLLGALRFFGRRRTGSPGSESGNRRWMLFFLLLGLSASLPLAASPRQFSHYIYPSLPWFALAFACAGERRLQAAWQRFLARPFGPVMARSLLGVLVILVGAQVARYHGQPGRHEDVIALADRLDGQMGRSRLLSVCPSLGGNVSLIAYLQRRSRIFRRSICRRAGRGLAALHTVGGAGSGTRVASGPKRPGLGLVAPARHVEWSTNRRVRAMSKATKEPLRGRCACSAIRYELLSEPMFVHCCHCTWCQRETGSAFALNALIEADRVVLLEGEPACVAVPSESGRGQRIWRCPACLVALWSNYGGAGTRVHFVRAGTLDEGHGVQPDIHIFTASRQPWVVLPKGVPAVPAYYDPREVWPAASQSRWRDCRSAGEA